MRKQKKVDHILKVEPVHLGDFKMSRSYAWDGARHPVDSPFYTDGHTMLLRHAIKGTVPSYIDKEVKGKPRLPNSDAIEKLFLEHAKTRGKDVAPAALVGPRRVVYQSGKKISLIDMRAAAAAQNSWTPAMFDLSKITLIERLIPEVEFLMRPNGTLPAVILTYGVPCGLIMSRGLSPEGHRWKVAEQVPVPAAGGVA